MTAVAAATNAAKDRGAETGTQFVVDVVIEPDRDDGVRVIRADGVPFGKKNLRLGVSGKNLKNNGGFQFQPIWHRREELGPAEPEKFTISVPNSSYRDLCKQVEAERADTRPPIESPTTRSR